MQPRRIMPKEFSTWHSWRIITPTEVMELGQKSFHSQKVAIAPQGTAILSWFPTPLAMRRDHLDAIAVG